MSKNRIQALFAICLLILVFTLPAWLFAGSGGPDATTTAKKVQQLIQPANGYGDESQLGVWATLVNRAQAHPFHIFSFLMFAFAIIHTFFTNSIQNYAHHLEEKEKKVVRNKLDSIMPEAVVTSRSFKVEILHFLGEVEIVFGIWVGPLLFGIMLYQDWGTSIAYMESRNFNEPFFVIMIMTIAATQPIIQFAERSLKAIAEWGKGSPAAWWLTILIVGPLLGSLITEPGAMTISALLLSRKFYSLKPSQTLCYATLGLLFCNVSVGGVLTHFAAPPVLMVAGAWGWDSWFMLTTFGWRAVIGIVTATLVYYYLFRKEFARLAKQAKEKEDTNKKKRTLKIPLWITLFHLALLTWIVVHAHFPIIVIGGFFIFLGFYQATSPYQADFTLRPALLVGFFLASLVIHGGLQGWWISPLLGKVHDLTLMGIGIGLTAFNDNAAVTYLTTLIPDFSPSQQYAVVAGAITGGGLTVIANAPNPAGQSLLHYYFDNGISPLYLFISAIFPTLIMSLCFAIT